MEICPTKIAAPDNKTANAREAAIAVREMAATALPSLHLISLIVPENEKSINLALGLKNAEFEKQIDFRNNKANIYRHKPPVQV